MKNKASFFTLLFIFVLGAAIAGCQGGEAPADTSGVKTPEQVKSEGITPPDTATPGAGGDAAPQTQNSEFN